VVFLSHLADLLQKHGEKLPLKVLPHVSQIRCHVDPIDAPPATFKKKPTIQTFEITSQLPIFNRGWEAVGAMKD